MNDRLEVTSLVDALYQVIIQFVTTMKNQINTSTVIDAIQNVLNTSPVSEVINDLENRPPIFCGQEHEDPLWFVEKMSQHFRRAGIDSNIEKIAAFRGQLCLEAREWYRKQTSYKNYQCYIDLVNSFLTYFNADSRIGAAIAHLYQEKQKADEEVASFIIKKEGLFKRLHPEMPHRRIVRIIAGQLKPETRLCIRGHDLRDIDQLLDLAMNADQCERSTEANCTTLT